MDHACMRRRRRPCTTGLGNDQAFPFKVTSPRRKLLWLLGISLFLRDYVHWSQCCLVYHVTFIP